MHISFTSNKKANYISSSLFLIALSADKGNFGIIPMRTIPRNRKSCLDPVFSDQYSFQILLRQMVIAIFS